MRFFCKAILGLVIFQISWPNSEGRVENLGRGNTLILCSGEKQRESFRTFQDCLQHFFHANANKITDVKVHFERQIILGTFVTFEFRRTKLRNSDFDSVKYEAKLAKLIARS